MNKKVLRIVPVIILILLATYLYNALSVENQSLYYGEITMETFDVYSKVPGIIDSVSVVEGQIIEAGQTLINIEDDQATQALNKAELAHEIALENVLKSVSPLREEDLTIQSLTIDQLESQKAALNETINGLQSTLSQNNANINALKEAYELASDNLERIETLYNSGAESKSALDQAEVNYSSSKSGYDGAKYQSSKLRADINGLEAQVLGLDAQIASAKERLVTMESGYDVSDQEITNLNAKLAEADLALAQMQVQDYTIKSKVSGVVESINYSIGEYVNPGTPVVTVADFNKALVKIYVHESDLMKINIDDALVFHLASDETIELKGKVKAIASEAMFTPVNVVVAEDRERLVFEVEVALENTEGVRSGMLMVTNFDELE